jgi:hypothetical protein
MISDEEDFDDEPVIDKRQLKQEKTSLIGSLLSKNSKINNTFDELKTQIKIPSKTRIPKMVKRRHGRPSGGKVHFEQIRIDALPEYGRVSEFARCLGIRDASLLQWVDLKDNPLPYVNDENTGNKIFRKDIVISWLESTGRYRRKPEYADKE